MWTVTVGLLQGNAACAFRSFLQDHQVRFLERRACGMVELRIGCTQDDALRLADALQFVGTRALFDGDGACLIVVRPEAL
jgi:hypothetical protein